MFLPNIYTRSLHGGYFFVSNQCKLDTRTVTLAGGNAMSDSLLEQIERKNKVLAHARQLIENVETYCDRDEDLSTDVLREMIHGIKNVIAMELD